MTLKARYLSSFIAEDLKTKMVFVGGPRQVGKTTLSKAIGINAFEPCQYLNWDKAADRATIRLGQFNSDAKLIIMDELHKYRPWKRLIKGYYDTKLKDQRFLVTGSAKLDVYRRGGDSLQGRYFYFRLHPFSVAEACHSLPRTPPGKELELPPSTHEHAESLTTLLKYGGFPEPFFAQSSRTWRRWQNQRLERIVKEDIRDVENIRDLSLLQTLGEILPSKVGSKLSINSIREDLELNHKTVTRWMDVLESFYYQFRIRPFSGNLIKSLRKEPKMYLWDWSQVEDLPARLENLVASHLLKLCHFLHDTEGYKADLHYLGNTEGHEVDFLVTVDKRPWFAVEVKMSDTEPSRYLHYFGTRLKIPHLYQVVQQEDVDFQREKVRVVSASKFLAGLV